MKLLTQHVVKDCGRRFEGAEELGALHWQRGPDVLG